MDKNYGYIRVSTKDQNVDRRARRSKCTFIQNIILGVSNK